MGSCISNATRSADDQTREETTRDIKTYYQLLQNIKKQIEDNQHAYGLGLLSQDIINILFEQLKKYSFTEEQLRDLSIHLLKYMRESFIRQTKGECKKDFVTEFGKKIRRVWDEAFFQNKNTLRVMSYLIRGIDERDCYLKLKFNLDPKETMAVASKTRQLCKYDLRAVLFLTHYLYSSCINLEKSGKRIQQIEKLFTDAVTAISKQFPPAPPLKDSEETRVHKSYKTEVNAKDSINLKEFEESKKKTALEKFILKQAEQASKNYNTFDELVEETCKQRGFHFKIGVKIRDQSQKRAIDRVTQKMLGKVFKKYTLQDYTKDNQKGNTIEEFIQKQEKMYQIQMEQIYSKVNEPIQFKVSDMLRAKCLFRTVTDINACTQQLKKKVENSNCKLVELDNRFSGQVKTSDIVLKILVKKTIAQLQLPIEFDVAQNEFAHKIYEITRSKFFSPFTMLKIINEEIKNEYLKQVVQYFKINNANSHEYQLQFYNSSFTEQQFKGVSFKNIQTSLATFLKMLNFVQRNPQLEKKSLVLQQIVNQFNQIRQQFKNANLYSDKQNNTILTYKNNGQYLKQIKRYQQSLSEFAKYLKQIQIQNSLGNQKITLMQKNNKFLREKSETYTSIGNVYKQLGNYKDAQNQYLTSLDIQEKLSGKQTIDCALIHNNVGFMYRKQGDYEKALTQYKISLQIQERVNGKEAVDCALIRNNIGDVYKEQGNYEMALQQFNKSLQIRYKKQGNQTIECAKIHNNIGSVYYLRGNYQKALKQYIRCLEIQQKMVGRQAIVCASTHNNIAGVYCLMGDYTTALVQYRRSLEIKERVVGKDSLDCAIVHSNIGDVLQKSGNTKIALQQYMKSLQIQERVLGKDALDCASTHMSIGGLLKEKGDFQTALRQLMKSLQISERILGKDDIKCASIHNGIGSIYRMQGRYKLSLQQYKRCLQIQENILGESAIDCASTHNNIGNLYRMLFFYQKALEQFTKCIQIQQNILGRQAVDCATTHINISSVLLQQGRYDMAIGQLVVCLRIQGKIFGQFSIECAATYNKIGDVLVNLRQFEQALGQYQRCLQIQEGKLGKGSREYINTLQKIIKIENLQNPPLISFPNIKPIDMTNNRPIFQIMARKIEQVPSKQKERQPKQMKEKQRYEKQKYDRQQQERQYYKRYKFEIQRLKQQPSEHQRSFQPSPVPYQEKRKLY